MNNYEREVKLKTKLLAELKDLARQQILMLYDIADNRLTTGYMFFDVKHLNEKIENVVYQIFCLTIIDD